MEEHGKKAATIVNDKYDINFVGQNYVSFFVQFAKSVFVQNLNHNKVVINLYEELVIKKGKQRLRLKQSKTFLAGDLIFRSIKSPHKLVTYPYNLIRILLKK